MDEDIREGYQDLQVKNIETDLRQFLHCLASQDLNVIKQTEEYLRQLERKDGFYAELMNIFYDRANDVSVRFMAIIYFKTSFEKYWRENKNNLKTDSRVISKEEKSYIVQKILSDFDEPVQQLGIQLAVVSDKILRLEHLNLRHVDAIFTRVLESVGSENITIRYQALSTFYQIVKSLNKDHFLRIAQMGCFVQTEQVLKILLTTCDTHLQVFFANLAGDVNNMQLLKKNVEIALLCLLSLCKILYSASKLHEMINDPISFLDLIMNYTKVAAEGRRSLLTRDMHFEEIDTLIIAGTKLMVQIPLKIPDEQKKIYIPKILDFAYYYCFTDEGQALVFEKFNINCLLMLKCDFQSGGVEPKARWNRRAKLDDTWTDESKSSKIAYFTREKQREACIKLITHYLLLTPAELEQISYLAFNDIGDAWKYSMRACVQHVFSSLFHDFTENFSAALIELVETQCQPINTDDLSTILLKDAIYNAIGLSSLDLYEHVNFEQWLKTSLIHELKLTGENSKILRRRIYWLIGEWIGVKCNQEIKDQLYRIIVEGLVSDPDVGVRLAACFAIQAGLQDFYFHFPSFSNNANSAFTGIFQLLQDIDDCDIKMRILSVLTDFADRMSHEPMPDSSVFCTYLPFLWHKYHDHHMLRCAVVTLAAYIIRWMKSKSCVWHSFVIEVISASCDLNQEGHIYYLEDGLDLWLSTLKNTTTASPEIMDLLNNMPMLIDRSADNLEICLEIINVYILLSPEEFTNRFARVLFDALTSIISDLKNMGVTRIMDVLNLYLGVQPSTPQLLDIVSPLMSKAFEFTIAGENDDICISSVRKCVLIGARFLLISQDGFEKVISEVARRRESTVEIIFASIISQWMDYMDHMGPNMDRKLMALAFCHLLSPNSPPFIFANFLRIIKIVLDTLEEIDVDEVGVVLEFDLNLEGNDFENDYGNEHDRREDQLEQVDFVHRTSLKNALWSQLMILKQTYGDSQFEELIDSDVRRLLASYETSEPTQ